MRTGRLILRDMSRSLMNMKRWPHYCTVKKAIWSLTALEEREGKTEMSSERLSCNLFDNLLQFVSDCPHRNYTFLQMWKTCHFSWHEREVAMVFSSNWWRISQCNVFWIEKKCRAGLEDYILRDLIGLLIVRKQYSPILRPRHT